jgi:hypothetical protein
MKWYYCKLYEIWNTKRDLIKKIMVQANTFWTFKAYLSDQTK